MVCHCYYMNSRTHIFKKELNSEWYVSDIVRPCSMRRRPWSLGRWDHGLKSCLRHGCLSWSVHHHLSPCHWRYTQCPETHDENVKGHSLA
jgi:hypothetical protein